MIIEPRARLSSEPSLLNLSVIPLFVIPLFVIPLFVIPLFVIPLFVVPFLRGSFAVDMCMLFG